MSRQRPEYSSIEMYHVITRGHEQKDIFHGNKNREKFLNILEQKYHAKDSKRSMDE